MSVFGLDFARAEWVSRGPQRTHVGIKKLGGTILPGDTPAGEGPKYIVTVSKFSDPILPVGDSYLGYLSEISDDANTRVAAMRAKIARDGYSLNFKFAGVRDGSSVALTEVARQLVVDRVNELRDKGGNAYEEAKNWLDHTTGGSIVQALWSSSVGPELLKRVRTAVNTLAGSAKDTATSTASGLSSVAAVAGAFVPLVLSIVGGMQADAAADEAARTSQCMVLVGTIFDKQKLLIDQSMPFAWQADQWITPCGSIEPGIENAERAVSATLFYTLGPSDSVRARDEAFLAKGDGFVGVIGAWMRRDASGKVVNYGEGLSLAMQVSLRRWWGLALLFWSDPKVGPVIASMCQDDGAGRYASDEQVMAVAAPIARSINRDVDSFARELWNRCPGWASRPDALVRFNDHVDNARFVQFAVLCDTAFAMADEAVSQDDSGSSTTTTVLTVAGVGLGLGLLAWVLL